MTIDHATIPHNALQVLTTLQAKGFEAYLVGGCVRDLILGRDPYDWDIATNAVPEEVIPLFEKTVHENAFGTVAVVFEDDELDDPARTIEVTTYRADGEYTDHRRPDSISYAETLAEDLARRDFTINAMAYDPTSKELVDLYQGQEHLQQKVILAVGNARERLSEDALRIMRAVRFAAQLGFLLAADVMAAIRDLAPNLKHIAYERIRIELDKLLLSNEPAFGLTMMRDLGILPQVLPEIAEGVDVGQNRSHIYDVFTHNINACQHAADKDYSLSLRLAALFHDVAKPRTKRFDKAQGEYTFYGHEVVGAKMTKAALKRLRYPKKVIEDVTVLVRQHMFFADTDQLTLSAVRRVITKVTPERIWDLIHLRYCDRIGMGRPKEDPYRLRKYEAMIEEALRDPISVKMLKLNGDIMIAEMGMQPGRRMGWILHALLEEVLDDPARNTREYLEQKAREFEALSDDELEKLGRAGKDRRDADEAEEIGKIRKAKRVR